MIEIIGATTIEILLVLLLTCLKEGAPVSYMLHPSPLPVATGPCARKSRIRLSLIRLCGSMRLRNPTAPVHKSGRGGSPCQVLADKL